MLIRNSTHKCIETTDHEFSGEDGAEVSSPRIPSETAEPTSEAQASVSSSGANTPVTGDQTGMTTPVSQTRRVDFTAQDVEDVIMASPNARATPDASSAETSASAEQHSCAEAELSATQNRE